MNPAELAERSEPAPDSSLLEESIQGWLEFSRKPIMNLVHGIIQGLLALMFLVAGGAKLVMPIATLTKQMALSSLLLRFIAVAEVLGALGLVLPGLLRIRPGLTPLAATGLVIIRTGATVLTLVVGNLSAFVAYGRWRPAPLRGASHS
jgi:hypothetical protein